MHKTSTEKPLPLYICFYFRTDFMNAFLFKIDSSFDFACNWHCCILYCMHVLKLKKQIFYYYYFHRFYATNPFIVYCPVSLIYIFHSSCWVQAKFLDTVATDRSENFLYILAGWQRIKMAECNENLKTTRVRTLSIKGREYQIEL